MTTNSTKFNSNIKLNSISNNDNLTNILAISTNTGSTKQVQIRNASTLSIPNQDLNTNSDVTFNTITSQSYNYRFNATMTFVMDNITITQLQILTTNNIPTTVYSLNTVNNKSYTVFAEVTMVDGSTSVSGNAGFIMTRRITNTSNVLDIGSVENIVSKQGNTTSSDFIFTASGATLNIQVVGIGAKKNYWTISLRIIKSP